MCCYYLLLRRSWVVGLRGECSVPQMRDLSPQLPSALLFLLLGPDPQSHTRAWAGALVADTACLAWELLYLQLNQHNAMVKAIPVRRVEKGQLLEYMLTDLRVPHSYEVRLTPYTTYGAGDMASRIIHYTERTWWWEWEGRVPLVSSGSPPPFPHGP